MLDVQLLRRSWPTLVEKLRGARKAILSSLLASATPVAFDGTTLEIAFPPLSEAFVVETSTPALLFVKVAPETFTVWLVP